MTGFSPFGAEWSPPDKVHIQGFRRGWLMGTGAPEPGYFLGPTLKACQSPRKSLQADTSHPSPSLDRAHTGPEVGEEVTALKTGKTDFVLNVGPGTSG